MSLVSIWKNRSLAPAQAASQAASDREHLAAAAYRRYQNDLKNRGMVDFDDLLLLTEKLLSGHAKIRRELVKLDQRLGDGITRDGVAALLNGLPNGVKPCA